MWFRVRLISLSLPVFFLLLCSRTQLPTVLKTIVSFISVHSSVSMPFGDLCPEGWPTGVRLWCQPVRRAVAVPSTVPTQTTPGLRACATGMPSTSGLLAYFSLNLCKYLYYTYEWLYLNIMNSCAKIPNIFLPGLFQTRYDWQFRIAQTINQAIKLWSINRLRAYWMPISIQR